MSDKAVWYEVWHVQNGGMSMIGLSTSLEDAMMMVPPVEGSKTNCYRIYVRSGQQSARAKEDI